MTQSTSSQKKPLASRNSKARKCELANPAWYCPAWGRTYGKRALLAVPLLQTIGPVITVLFGTWAIARTTTRAQRRREEQQLRHDL
jgi:hypothetical protein